MPLEEATSREAAITYGAVDVKEDRTKLLPRDGQYRGSITAGDVAQAARLGDKLNNSYKRLVSRPNLMHIPLPPRHFSVPSATLHQDYP